MTDSSTHRVRAVSLLRGRAPRDPQSQAARLASQFISQNRSTLALLGATAEPSYDGQSVEIVIRSSTQIGAVPLRSPTTGRPEYGLVVRPRFDWRGVGPMLAEMGWRIVPSVLALPLLPRSERRIPRWVLSTIILVRIRAMLDDLQRRFELIQEDRSAPRGTVDWTTYALKRVPRADLLSVPCRYSDLRDDRSLKSAIRFTLMKQLQSLEGQRMAGVVVLALLGLCQKLIERVRDVPPREPSPRELDTWIRAPLHTAAFRDGVRAIEWTVDERGLAGPSDLQGLPWSMSMAEFFEAWSETVLDRLARSIGGVLKTGRRSQTVAPLNWEPPYLGSQKYLLPDIVLERGDTTIIVDAKYKEHWEEMQERPWMQQEEELRERHRGDLLQVLAYANLATTPRIVTCLAYPARRDTWESLRARGRLVHRASLRAGERDVRLLLTAFPMGSTAAEIASVLRREVEIS